MGDSTSIGLKNVDHPVNYSSNKKNIAFVDENGRRWYDAWTRVTQWDVDSNLGLFVGDSGNASALLSLYAKNKGIKISTLPEFEA